MADQDKGSPAGRPPDAKLTGSSTTEGGRESFAVSGFDGEVASNGSRPFRRDRMPAPVLPLEDVDLGPEWGVVTLQGLSVKEKAAFDKSFIVGKGRKQTVVPDDLKAKMAVRGIVDPVTRQRMFRDDEWVIFNDYPATILDRLFEPMARMSSHTAEDEEELEALAKNSKRVRSGSGS